MTAFVELSDVRVVAGEQVLVRGASLTLRRGATLGVVGESGSGKSMLVKALTGLLPAGVGATGTFRLGGDEIPLAASERAWSRVRGRRVVLVPQDPFTSLDPMRRCGAQVLDALPTRPRRSARHAEAVRRLAEVGLPERVARQYPHELSGGMRQRVAIAAALAAEPELLVADEPTTALDVTTQREILDLLADLQARRGLTLVLITHDLLLARERCDDLLVLYAGTVVEHGPAADVFRAPAHPYTAALHDANPPVDRRLDRLPAIPGAVPRASDGPGCPFVARCPVALERCRTAAVPLVPVPDAPGRAAACLLVGAAPGAVRPEHAARPAHVATDLRPAHADDAADAPVLLRVDGLVKEFRGTGHRALDGVSVVVHRGASVGIVGESGSGKTTLARCVVGLEQQDAGTVRFGGTDARPGPRDVQIVFQDPYSALNPALTIGAMLREALGVRGASVAGPAGSKDGPADDGVPSTPEGLLRLVGLPEHYARRRPARLSGGERQRVAIARALAPAPRVLVCDESVSALDVSVQAQVLNLLSDLRARLGLTLLFVSHDLAVVRQVTDHVYVLRAGRVVEEGATQDVLDRPRHEYTRALLAAVPGAAPTPALVPEAAR